MSASHWHYLLFAQPHILEGHHKFPQILRMVLENRRSGTCCAFILHGLKINLGPVKLIFFYSLYVSPFCVLLVSTAAPSTLLTLLLGQLKGVVAHQCPYCFPVFGVDGSSSVSCVCENTSGGGARDIGFRSSSIR